MGLRVVSVLYRLRLAVYAASLITALAFGGCAVYLSARLVGSLSISTEAKDITSRAQGGDGSGGVHSAAGTLAAVGSEAGLPPERVWLAENADGYEFYSNGARILTELETTGPERRFYQFNLDGESAGNGGLVEKSEPVGIVYHLSESDLLPFANRYNSSLQSASRALLEYSREHHLYNYVIDRFGRIYRIVRDEFASSHAGNSLWSDGKSVYINLSASFLGICLEGRSAAGTVGPDGINEAQIYAARVLTTVLRSKYGIEDANCVTHGLVSVNPSNRLVGYHTDWVSGFPFEALGLSNKYESELVAISRFGFTYDQKYVASAGGKKWAGLDRADRRLEESANNNGNSVDEERRTRWQVFQRAYEEQRDLDLQRTRLASSAGAG